MDRRAFFYSLLGLAAVAALPASKAEAAQPAIDPVLGPLDETAADLPADGAVDAQYYTRRRVVRRRVVYRRPVFRRRVVYRQRVYYRRPVVYRRPLVRLRRVYW